MDDVLHNFWALSYGHFLGLAALLFLVGVIGVIIRRSALIVLMSIELMLNAANMTVITFSRMHGAEQGMHGHSLAFVIIAVAAAEAAVGLAIVVAVFRSRQHADIDRLTSLKH